jgi:CO/xanthine dehydrogenase Mo-binding subunit
MNTYPQPNFMTGFEDEEFPEPSPTSFRLNRREFVQVLGAGLLLAVTDGTALAQRSGGRGGGRPATVAARIHLGTDGTVTVMVGKVEMGQGSRAELTQAAAEELCLAPEQIRLIMSDTGLVPDDGVTAGSGTTPRTVPAVRHAAAAARYLLVGLACKQWGVEQSAVEVRSGVIRHAPTNRELTYASLANSEETAKALAQNVPPDVTLTPVKQWKVLGTSFARPNRRDLVTGAHQFPSDITRPGMLYGKMLRPPSYGAKLTGIDLAPAKAMEGVVVVQEESFVGVAAPTTFRAGQALSALAKTASWEPAPHPSSQSLFTHLKERARGDTKNPFEAELAKSSKVIRQTYHVAYVQHAPMETRVALAEWQDGKLTVWTGTQAPFGYRSELERTFGLSSDQVRVIVPDIGGGFGGKHTGEVAVEAARLAKAAGRPVLLKWTRVEEFTWAYFRPAGVIEAEASLDAQGSISTWHFVNINSGPSAVESPYGIPNSRSRSVQSDPPLRQGSYRALAATANNFARECLMDELAHAAGADPLAFRLAHLGERENQQRLRAVLETAAKRFDWSGRSKKNGADIGVGLACGTEKGSYVAACVEVSVDRDSGKIKVKRVCEVFECGAVLNPDNMLSQAQGCIIMGLGAALREAMEFENGKILNASFGKYQVPRFKDLPELDIHLLDRPDLASAGGGETPIIAIAPAIANAVFHATGTRIREMPIRFPAAKPS